MAKFQITIVNLHQDPHNFFNEVKSKKAVAILRARNGFLVCE